MARWLSFFAEYNFCVEYKPDKINGLAAHASRVTTDLYDRIRLAYQEDENYTPPVQFLSDDKDAKVDRLSPRRRVQLHRYELANGLLHYRVDTGDLPRVVVPNDEALKYDILLEAHDAPISGHLCREKTYQTISETFWWPRMYKWVAHYVKTCETCQRSLPVPADCWKSMSLDFVFGLPTDDKGNTGILVFVCRLSKMVHLAPVRDKITGKQAAQLFLDSVFRYHGLPETIVSDRDPRFTGAFWDTLFQLLGTKLTMSTVDHPQTDGQTERVNRVLENTLRVFTQQCGTLINGVYPGLHEWVSTPPGAANLTGGTVASIVSGGEARKAFSSQVSEIEPESLKRQLPSFIDDRLMLTSRRCNGINPRQTKGVLYSDRKGRGNLSVFNVDELVLLDATNLPQNWVSFVGSNKLKNCCIGPFAVLTRHGTAYTIDLSKAMAMHLTLYVECLKWYHDRQDPSPQL
ncbi:LOW QUALITY PROTEIN: Putative retroelement [Phytophthora palmivora]|uniref:Retroelement n=1 Tax=Phytophthora palmivora TaxID=4796 RepID=A0A2P4WY50_9STRA|nr:LOW QUALITY PROTEIN: Putative retroelement [Phytophthora palmivora]